MGCKHRLCGRSTHPGNEAKVSWNALMIQVDWLSVMPSEFSRDGMAEKRAELLNASRNWAKQKIMRRRYRRNGENRWGTLPSTSVWVGERTWLVGACQCTTVKENQRDDRNPREIDGKERRKQKR